jgi:hypothetical protein
MVDLFTGISLEKEKLPWCPSIGKWGISWLINYGILFGDERDETAGKIIKKTWKKGKCMLLSE